MNSIKRMFISVKGHLGGLVDEFENHEALAEVAIRNVECAGADAKSQLNRVAQEVEYISRKIEALEKEEKKWAERAFKVHNGDQEKALQCVARMQTLQDQVAYLKDQLTETEQIKHTIENDVEQITQKRDELLRKKELLHSRQNRVDISQVTEIISQKPNQSVDDIFSRWEARIVRSEFSSNRVDIHTDALKTSFEQQERQEELKAKLDELIKNR